MSVGLPTLNKQIYYYYYYYCYYHLRKSADRKAQIRKAFVPLTELICAFRSADFLRWCLSSERNLTHNFFFLFPIVFGINYYVAGVCADLLDDYDFPARTITEIPLPLRHVLTHILKKNQNIPKLLAPFSFCRSRLLHVSKMK